jgi:hypothetical protein
VQYTRVQDKDVEVLRENGTDRVKLATGLTANPTLAVPLLEEMLKGFTNDFITADCPFGETDSKLPVMATSSRNRFAV